MDFVFVIPIVHPHGPGVSNYLGVECLLRMTLASLSSQTAPRTAAVVVCHKLPEWHDEFEHVRFLVMPEDSRFPIKYVHRHIDKSIKLVAGSLFALNRYSPKYIMPIDGDDLFRTDLAEIALSAAALADDEDGWIVTRGFNLDLFRDEDRLAFRAAYSVNYFHRHCGSCRIVSGRSVRRVLTQIAPNASSMDVEITNSETQELSNAYVDALFEDADPAFPDFGSRFRLFGDHMRQDTVFRLKHMPIELACKSCGHENHVGPRQGSVHWHRVTGRKDLDIFISDFGLKDAPFVVPNPAPDNPMETLIRPLWAKVVVTWQLVQRKSLHVLAKLARSRTS